MSNLNDVDYARMKVKSLQPNDGAFEIKPPRPAHFVKTRELADNGDVLNNRKGKSGTDEDTAKADGISLDMDSPEYWERDLDIKGIPEHEQERFNREAQQRGERVGQRSEHESDKWHENYTKGNVEQRNNRQHEFEYNQHQKQPSRLVSMRMLEKEAAVERLAGLGQATHANREKIEELGIGGNIKELESELSFDMKDSSYQRQLGR